MEKTETSSYYPENEIIYIINCIKTGDNEKLLSAVENFTNAIIDNYHSNYENALQIIYQLFGIMISYVTSLNMNKSRTLFIFRNLYQELSKYKILDEYKAKIIDTSAKIIQLLKDENIYQDKSVNRIIEYLDLNFKKELSIELISNELDISCTTLRRKFKDELGITIMEYIANKRVLKEKKMLIETNRTVEDISQAVGYNNFQNFNRTFKKIEGISPTQFRLSK
jgi:AraC-like DNA-binding protein